MLFHSPNILIFDTQGCFFNAGRQNDFAHLMKENWHYSMVSMQIIGLPLALIILKITYELHDQDFVVRLEEASNLSCGTEHSNAAGAKVSSVPHITTI